MGFKMKSGNTPKFKMVGSSPAKQVNTDLDSGELYNRLRDQEAVNRDLENKNKSLRDASKDSEYDRDKRILEGKATDKDRAQQTEHRQETEEMKQHMPWSEETKSKYSDPDMAKYAKSRKEIKAERKLDKEKSRSRDSEGGKDITKKEKYDNRTRNLNRKYQDAQATGKMGVKFNWKDMFSGQGIMGGFSVAPKRDILADKIKKRDEKTKTSKKVDATTTERKNLKKERKLQNKYDRYVKNYKPQFKDDDEGPVDYEYWKKNK